MQSNFSEKCKNLFIALNAYLNRGLSAADKDYEKWCNIINSGTGIEEYPIAIITGSMREWIGERIIHEISGNKLTVVNRDYEHTEQILRNDIEDDKYGFFGPVFQEMGINAGILRNPRIVPLLRIICCSCNQHRFSMVFLLSLPFAGRLG